MTVIRYITATSLALALMATVFVSPVLAETTAEQNQKLEQEVEVECSVTGYGESKCKARGKQTGEQSQKILGVFRQDGTFVPTHKTVNTGLDNYSLALVSGTVIAGSAAAYLKVKNRKA